MSRQNEETRIVRSMATMVLGKLRANAFKPHWRKMSYPELCAAFESEVIEFRQELNRIPIKPAKLAMEAADIVAVLCMMVDTYRTESE